MSPLMGELVARLVFRSCRPRVKAFANLSRTTFSTTLQTQEQYHKINSVSFYSIWYRLHNAEQVLEVTRSQNKRAQRALGRSPEENIKGHSGAIYRGTLMLSTKYWQRTSRWCYTSNMKALGLVVSDKIFENCILKTN